MKRKTPPDPDREELWDAIKNNNLGKYTPKQIEKGMLQKDLCEENLYHWAAKKRTLQNIPPEFLTKENLLLPNNDGWTCLHLAALWGCLDKIPKELLTKDHLLQESRQGYNSLHFAAWSPFPTKPSSNSKPISKVSIPPRTKTTSSTFSTNNSRTSEKPNS
jgi:hypothetical protein